jgi:hypothetical protein
VSFLGIVNDSRFIQYPISLNPCYRRDPVKMSQFMYFVFEHSASRWSKYTKTVTNGELEIGDIESISDACLTSQIPNRTNYTQYLCSY